VLFRVLASAQAVTQASAVVTGTAQGFAAVPWETDEMTKKESCKEEITR
jgi:hypothetical protein